MFLIERKNSFFRLTVLFLSLFFVGSVSVIGQTTVSHNFSSTSGVIDANISFSTAKNSSSNNPYSNGSELRLYYHSSGNGGSVTLIPSNGAVITGVIMEATATSRATDVEYNVDGGADVSASLSSTTYTISGLSASTSLKLRNANNSSKQLRLSDITITYTILAAGPNLVVTPSSLSGLDYVLGSGASNVQSFELSGSNLTTANVELLTVNDYCEISETVVGGFSHYIDLGVYDGSSKTIYVRLESGLTLGSYLDQILITGGGMSSANEPVVDLEGDVTSNSQPVEYCEAEATNDGYEHISNVEINTIDNYSTSNGYEDYTAISTDVTAGQSYSLTVANGSPYSNDVLYVWIDWNQDGDFDEFNEEVVSGVSASNNSNTINITIPLTATPGATRMRLRLQDSGSGTQNLTPCGDHTYGEVEDYALNIIAPCSVPAPTSPSSTQACGSTEFAATTSSATESTFWQTLATGTSTLDPANVTKNVTTNTAIYLRTFSSSENCWSDALTINPSIIEAPVISSQPLDQSEIVGQVAVFSVSSSNSSSYQWQVSTDNGGNWANISGEVNASISVTGLTLAMDGYQYRVNVLADSPCIDVLSDVVTLTVVTGPCLSDNFNSSYGNWTGGSGTYKNSNAGTTGNGIGFNSNYDDIITSSTITNPQSISFNCKASGSGSEFTINIQYSTSASGPWTTSVTLDANGSNTGDITNSTALQNINLNLNGTYYLRFLQSPRSGGSFYLDDVEVYCGSSTPSCTPTASITSFIPVSGPLETLVTITGSGFTGVTAVKFGATDALSYSVINDNTIIAEVPSGVASSLDIYVEDGSNCEAQSASSFTVIEHSGSCSSYAGYTDLFISEVFDEGSGNGWYLELFNPTTSSITLTNVYEIE